MDVTPFGKQTAIPSTSQTGTPAVNRSNVVKYTREDTSVSTGPDADFADPIKRAEEAIGGFFTDSNYPSGRFSIDQDKDSGRYVYRLIDRNTDEVLKQFPGDYVLRRVAYYRELQGLAVNSEV
ncbi:flagellar protein FlaG [Sneathiella sp.]|uniref:flagellar protein FlaG n=1 Tax=Sneathiella sp. TaxID=1964365 RepID=UPI00263926D8|nr:flagellar protein FlaG [Sneathiella sp.]MDF2365983.1 flagellar protein FlaG [Sneathiella sp.]